MLLLFSFNSFSQEIKKAEEQTKYLSVNLLPTIGTTIELGYEKNFIPQVSLSIYGGYTFSYNFENYSQTQKITEYLKNSGAFIKLETKITLRKDLNKIRPFIGFIVLNSLSIEESKTTRTGNTILYKTNEFNLGVVAVIGVTSSATKRLNVDLGLQFGTLLINNLATKKSYLPGMGIDIFGNGYTTQGVLRVKYRIN
ncbi:MAG: hypothetical protein ABF258_00945 [Flavobacteriales bacterium]